VSAVVHLDGPGQACPGLQSGLAGHTVTTDPKLMTCPACVLRTLIRGRCPEHLAPLWADRQILIGGWCPACAAWWWWDRTSQQARFQFPDPAGRVNGAAP
jgi:hypothetical protein